MQRTTNLDEVVKGAILQIINNYKRTPRAYLTEADVVSDLACDLKSMIMTKHGELAVHCELRPFQEINLHKRNTKQKYLVIVGDRWVPQQRANSGAHFDIIVVSNDKEFWRRAYENALYYQGKRRKRKVLSYWRFLSYPVDAFYAVVEVKVRVSGNVSKIKRDMDRLFALQKKNSNCFTYVLVLDRKAKPRDKKYLKEYSERLGISCFLD